MSFECSHQEVPGNPGVSWVLTRLKGEGIDKEKCNNPSSLDAGENTKRKDESAEGLVFFPAQMGEICKCSKGTDASEPGMVVSIRNPGIRKAGAGGSLAQDSRDVWGELVFSNRGISGKSKSDTEWDREKQTGFHP